MTEEKVLYKTDRPMTDAERFSAITQPAQIVYLLTIRLLDAKRCITLSEGSEIAERIGYGVSASMVGDAVREWFLMELVEVAELPDGRRVLAFAAHEFIPPPAECDCTWEDAAGDKPLEWTSECGFAFTSDDVSAGEVKFCPACGGLLFEALGGAI